MRKIYLFVALYLIAATSHGQSQFTVNDCFQINDSSKLQFSVFLQPFQTFIPQTGNNYIWNFSLENWTSPTVPYNFQPASQSIHSLFSNSEINEYSNTSFARDLFFTHSTNFDTLYYDGLYSGGYNYVYSPRIPYLTFPLTYQDSVHIYVKQYANPNQPNTPTGSVSRYWIYDGYGTLQLPYGTISDVFRVRTKQIDSVYVLNSGSETEEIIWFKKNEGIPVLRFIKNSNNINAYYSASTSTSGIQKNNFSDKLTIYPNPAINYITINSDENIVGNNYYIFDTEGKIIFSGNISNQEQKIDISMFSNGLYFLQVGKSCIQQFNIIKN